MLKYIFNAISTNMVYDLQRYTRMLFKLSVVHRYRFYTANIGARDLKTAQRATRPAKSSADTVRATGTGDAMRNLRTTLPRERVGHIIGSERARKYRYS